MFRYIGNKTKLLPAIMEATQEAIGESGTVVDLMAGTGSVALEYRRSGYSVIASDMMTYSKCHLITQLLYNVAPSFAGLSRLFPEADRYNRIVEYLNELRPVQGYFFQEFSPAGTPANGCAPRKYFTAANAARVDAIREQIRKWIEDGSITDNEAAVLKHTLIMAVNDVANISGTYGYYLSTFRGSALENIQLSPVPFDPHPNTNHTVLQGFAEDLAPTICADLCYIDPPYMKRQYAANYHILETIARGDYPKAVGKSGLRDWWDQHSKLCTKTRGLTSFETIIKEMDCPVFLISYSEDGLFSLNQLTTCFQQFGEVSIREIDYKRFRSNQSPLPKSIKEYIIKLHKG